MSIYSPDNIPVARIVEDVLEDDVSEEEPTSVDDNKNSIRQRGIILELIVHCASVLKLVLIEEAKRWYHSLREIVMVFTLYAMSVVDALLTNSFMHATSELRCSGYFYLFAMCAIPLAFASLSTSIGRKDVPPAGAPFFVLLFRTIFSSFILREDEGSSFKFVLTGNASVLFDCVCASTLTGTAQILISQLLIDRDSGSLLWEAGINLARNVRWQASVVIAILTLVQVTMSLYAATKLLPNGLESILLKQAGNYDGESLEHLLFNRMLNGVLSAISIHAAVLYYTSKCAREQHT